MKSLALIASSFCLALTLTVHAKDKAAKEKAASEKPTAKQVKAVKDATSRRPTSADANNSEATAALIGKKLGCEDVELKSENLDAANPTNEDIFASCRSSCGSGGCGYHIFRRGIGGLDEVGEFFGTYQISSDASEGLFNIEVRSAMGRDSKVNFILKFNGQQYE